MWVTLWGGAFVLSVAIAQTTTSPDPGLSFTQLGIASIVCVLLFSWGWSERRERLKAQAECQSLQADMLRREREQSNGTIPILKEVTALLERVPGQVADAQSSNRQALLDQALQRLEAAAAKIIPD